MRRRGALYSSAPPRMSVVQMPPIHTVSAVSMLMTPRRPTRAPCEALYEGGAVPFAISHCATPALKHPVTGVSTLRGYSGVCRGRSSGKGK